ncbi:MAG: QueT transporter family protein, partial [Oscillospiraceae bacterium]|nr:QueT transporter family protein [Oscillospiraceae bacterium]
FLVGTLASFLAATGMWHTRYFTIKKVPLLGLMMPAITNAFLVGWELMVYIGGGFWINALYVAIGEALVMLTLGMVLYFAIKARQLDKRLF